MKKEKIFQIGDWVIRAKSKKVADPKSSRVRLVIQRMIRAMHEKHLVGIAAPQIGVDLRIFITQPRSTKFRTQRKKETIVIYINPKIIVRSKGTESGYEGCGSVVHAGIFGKVPRPKKVTVRAQNQEGKWFTVDAEGLLARIIQHEYDHLDGIVFLDRVKDTRTLVDRKAYLSKKK